MNKPTLRETLTKYLPPEAVDTIADWIIEHQVKVKITKDRFTKLGDYRPPQNGDGHRISINYNLNQYAFLITLVHEIAHLKTFQTHKKRTLPHGAEWKHEFKLLMFPFLNKFIFPQDVLLAVNNYIQNPAATSCTDLHLQRVLKNYDQKETDVLHLEDIPNNSIFSLQNGRLFRKEEKLRKRYKCIDLKSNRTYLVSPLAEVTVKENFSQQ